MKDELSKEVQDFISSRIKNYDPMRKESSVGVSQATMLMKALTEERKLDVELQKHREQLEWERSKSERDHCQEDKTENKRLITGILTFLGGLAATGSVIYQTSQNAKMTRYQTERLDRRFEMACRKEKDEPFLGLTETSTAKDGLHR